MIKSKLQIGKLILKDGTEFVGESFGYPKNTAGEVVFTTGMVGYPESLTDPSYLGQILVFTYPLLGNYGVSPQNFWESSGIKVAGLIVSNYIDTPSHWTSTMSLGDWLKKEKIPALQISDTRQLTQKIRTHGTMLGKIVFNKDISFYDPDKENLINKVSTKKMITVGEGRRTILLVDCGAKNNIVRCLLSRGVKVIIVPWDFNPFSPTADVVMGPVAGFPPANARGKTARLREPFHLRHPSLNSFDAIVISNGPGDPKKAKKTIAVIKEALKRKVPLLGICLGHQLLALAAGGETYKLKFGHRSQNQPCILCDTGSVAGFPPANARGEPFHPYRKPRCFITTQNHGFAVAKIPAGFQPWFINANDGTNEGIIHEKYPFMSVQFHPEACPGPTDTEWIFDYFLSCCHSESAEGGRRIPLR